VAYPSDRLSRRDRLRRCRIYRGARYVQDAFPPAIPLVIRNASVIVEASPRPRTLRMVRHRDAAVAVAVPGGVPGVVAADRPADSLDARQCRQHMVVARMVVA